MSYITDSYALSGETLVKQFKKRNMEAFYCATKEEAKEKILSMIPNGFFCHLGWYRIYGRSRCM